MQPIIIHMHIVQTVKFNIIVCSGTSKMALHIVRLLEIF